MTFHRKERKTGQTDRAAGFSVSFVRGNRWKLDSGRLSLSEKEGKMNFHFILSLAIIVFVFWLCMVYRNEKRNE
jgi:hypothetical protein